MQEKAHKKKFVIVKKEIQRLVEFSCIPLETVKKFKNLATTNQNVTCIAN